MEEMIEKQITVLIPKSHEDKFNEVTKHFDKFSFDYYEKLTDKNLDILNLFLSSKKLKID